MLMLPFKNYGPIDRVERKALLVAGLCCCIFIGFLSVVSSRTTEKRKVSANIIVPTPLTPPQILVPETTPLKYSNEDERYVPENFKRIDFRNHSYGQYSNPKSGVINLTLKESELELPNNRGWFSLQDVYYKDLTGDGKPEAIVRLLHVECGASCDGGAELFYIYGHRGGKLFQLWKYETGSYAYGCGLKSLTVNQKQIVIELFGRCPESGIENPGSMKFISKDLTYILFEFKGNRFARTMIEYFDTKTVNVENYQPEIYIY